MAVSGIAGHLLHVGFPKAGSKFLQHWFEAHPQLRFGGSGLQGYKDVYALARAAAAPAGPEPLWNVTSYEGLTAPRASAGAVRFDYAQAPAVPIAEAQSRACALLAGLFPGARVLVVTRGFRSMMLSSYSQYVRSGGTGEVEALLERDDGESHWNYDHVLGLYRRAFGEDAVLVLPFELLRDDPRAFLGQIERWLGLEPLPLETQPLNRSLSAIELRWYPRLTRRVARLPLGSRLRERLLTRFVEGVMADRWSRAVRWLQRLMPAPPVTADLIPQASVERFRGHADSLRDNPLYAAYGEDYLFNA